MKKYSCVLLAGGSGERMGLGYNKVLYKINGKKELFRYSFDAFYNHEECEEIVIVSSENDYAYFENFQKTCDKKKVKIVTGGNTRGESVYNGLKAALESYVMIHDSARPMVSTEELDELSEMLEKENGVCLASKVYDTIADAKDGYIEGYEDRSKLVSIKTPQCFKKDLIMKAYEKAFEEKLVLTDDTAVYRKYIGDVKLVLTDSMSLKATVRDDLKILEVVLDENR